MEEATTFGESAIYEWNRRGGSLAKQVVAVNDGAKWIQSFIDYHCPKATRVIDFAHAQHYLAKVGKLIYGADSDFFQQWYRQVSRQLGTKPPHRTLSDLRFLRKKHANSPDFTEIEQAIRYLEHRKEMIDYPHFRKKGIPIGSGIVESGHRVVMHRRMKQAGMRWAEENINPMLTLRTALCNQRWSQTWHMIQAHQLSHRKTPSIDEHNKQCTTLSDNDVVSEKDVCQLEHLARKIETIQKNKRAWDHHRDIFSNRSHRSHKN